MSVQDTSETKEIDVKAVSIHPMCRFKLSDIFIKELLFAFQYILCVGSS